MTDFDHQLDHDLRRLPAPRAPETLLPRVMRAVAQAESTPWYSRGWSAWPAGLKVASAAAFVLFITGLWTLVPAGQQWLADVVSPAATEAWTRVAPIAHLVAQATTLGRLVWDLVLGPIAAHFLVLAILLSSICAVFWTAVTRLALGGAASQ